MLFDKVVLVEQRQVTGTHGNMTWQTVSGYSAVPMNIQPLRGEFQNMNQGMFFKTYKGFTTASGIVEDMRLTVSGTGEKYIVRGRERFDYIVMPHYELILETDTSGR